MGRKRAIVREPWEKHGWQTWLGSAVHSRTPCHRHPGARPACGRPGPRRPPALGLPLWGSAMAGWQGRGGPPGRGMGAFLPPTAWGSPRVLLGGPGLQKAMAWVMRGGFSCLIFVLLCLNISSRPPHFLSLVCRAFCTHMLLMSLWEGGLKHTSCSLTEAHLGYEHTYFTAWRYM